MHYPVQLAFRMFLMSLNFIYFLHLMIRLFDLLFGFLTFSKILSVA